MSPPDRRDLLVAAWWTASLRTRTVPIAWAGAGLVFGGCAEILSEMPADETGAALEAQQQDGWNVGSEGHPLVFPGARETDISGSAGWRDALATLASRLAPADGRWAPYYGPTLFQSLEAPRNADLRAVTQPIFTPEMELASRRGEALLSLLAGDGVCRSDVAVVLDLPGPEATATAAALAPCLDPVFVLNNWPHPMGVVPAHLTLGAALYLLPSFERGRARRPATAAPVFVLDRQRFAPYTDDAGLFDNRYLVGLPPLEALRSAGIHHLLYVTPDDSVALESDDLNDDLIAIDAGGIDVKLLALSDFSERPLPDWPDLPSCGPPPAIVGPGPQLYFGGSPGAHGCFSFWYGWHPSPPDAIQAGPSLQIPVRLAPRCRYRPAPRATFPGASHATRPGGGWRGTPGHAWRSGSMGRMHFGGWG